MKKYSKDFFLVVIGQIISLFGNQILRFVLPLYLLNQTGSAALFGTVSACAFIPMIILCPVGGIIADRVNKRNIMVILDFSTAALILILSLLLGQVDVVILLLAVLIVLYGIQGAYQPAVQASLPVLVKPEQLISGQAMYGGLFEVLKTAPFLPFYGAAVVTCILCVVSRNVFNGMDELMESYLL